MKKISIALLLALLLLAACAPAVLDPAADSASALAPQEEEQPYHWGVPADAGEDYRVSPATDAQGNVCLAVFDIENRFISAVPMPRQQAQAKAFIEEPGCVSALDLSKLDCGAPVLVAYLKGGSIALYQDGAGRACIAAFYADGTIRMDTPLLQTWERIPEGLLAELQAGRLRVNLQWMKLERDWIRFQIAGWDTLYLLDPVTGETGQYNLLHPGHQYPEGDPFFYGDYRLTLYVSTPAHPYVQADEGGYLALLYKKEELDDFLCFPGEGLHPAFCVGGFRQEHDPARAVFRITPEEKAVAIRCTATDNLLDIDFKGRTAQVGYDFHLPDTDDGLCARDPSGRYQVWLLNNCGFESVIAQVALYDTATDSFHFMSNSSGDYSGWGVAGFLSNGLVYYGDGAGFQFFETETGEPSDFRLDLPLAPEDEAFETVYCSVLYDAGSGRYATLQYSMQQRNVQDARYQVTVYDGEGRRGQTFQTEVPPWTQKFGGPVNPETAGFDNGIVTLASEEICQGGECTIVHCTLHVDSGTLSYERETKTTS